MSGTLGLFTTITHRTEAQDQAVEVPNSKKVGCPRMDVQDKDEMPGFPCLGIPLPAASRAPDLTGPSPSQHPELLLRSLFCYHDRGLHLHCFKTHAKVTDMDLIVCDQR